MKKEKSCGAIVYREKDGVEILLIKHKNGGHWAFPKGHVENKETEEETALREIWERPASRSSWTRASASPWPTPPSPRVEGRDLLRRPVRRGQDPRPARGGPGAPVGAPFQALQTVTYDSDREILQSFLEYYQKKA